MKAVLVWFNNVVSIFIEFEWRIWKFSIYFLQGYQKELALLNASYYSDVNNHEVFKLENLQFVSDFIFGYPIVKSTILQTQANYKAACAGDGGPKKTFLFRLRFYVDKIISIVPRKILNFLLLILDQIWCSCGVKCGGCLNGNELHWSNSCRRLLLLLLVTIHFHSFRCWIKIPIKCSYQKSYAYISHCNFQLPCIGSIESLWQSFRAKGQKLRFHYAIG